MICKINVKKLKEFMSTLTPGNEFTVEFKLEGENFTYTNFSEAFREAFRTNKKIESAISWVVKGETKWKLKNGRFV